EELCQQGKAFANKIWNAFRLIKGWEIADSDTSESAQQAVLWFEAKLNHTLVEIEDHFQKFRISDALMAIYKLIWEDFCSWYLEAIKPEYGSPMDSKTYSKTIQFLEDLLIILHPFMPFLTQELWQNII